MAQQNPEGKYLKFRFTIYNNALNECFRNKHAFKTTQAFGETADIDVHSYVKNYNDI